MTDYPRRSVLKGIGIATLGLAAPAGTAAGDGDAKVRVAHASPDAPAVDVYLGVAPGGNDPTIAGLEFTDVTGYLEVPAGEYEVTITVAGTNTAVPPTPVTLDLDAEDYTVAAVGELAPEGDEPSFTPDVFQDKLGVLRGDDGRVRVYHASPDAPAVDVAVAGPNDEPAVYLAQGLTFGNAGPNVEVAAGTYPVAVYLAGGETPVFGPVDVEVRKGEVLTVFAEGNLSPETLPGSSDPEPGFQPVLAYEEAAPFGRGPPPGRP